MSDWPVSKFETDRPELCVFLKNGPITALENGTRQIIIRAPVKSGKRQMAEYMARRDCAIKPRRVHIFISAWNRVADKEQHHELSAYGLETYIGLTQSKVNECTNSIDEHVKAGIEVICHLDECDHGSGDKQILSRIWKKIRDNASVVTVLYSATPQEVLFSGEVEDDEHEMINDMMEDGQVFNYTPPAAFRGPTAFLDAGLIHEAKPFFMHAAKGLVLSEQGKYIINSFRNQLKVNPNRNVIVLRLSYTVGKASKAQKKDSKAIYQFLRNIDSFSELDDFIVFVDKGDCDVNSPRVLKEKIDWSNRTWWSSKTTHKPILVVCDQTSSRSTEWACHDRVFTYHDFRNQLTFTVTSQAQERVNHFIGEKYSEFQPIHVYGSVKTWKLSAGLIGYNEFLNHEWYMRKVDKRTSSEPLYVIKKTSDDTLHPSYPKPISFDDACSALQDLGCASDVSLSARVAGTLRAVPDVNEKFIPCTKDTFERYRAAGVMGSKTCPNPFIQSEEKGLVDGKYTATIRGVCGVLSKEDARKSGAISKTNRERRIICYDGDVLGVMVRLYAGEKMMDTLSAYKSMYGSRTV
jgi:hypothetical protein